MSNARSHFGSIQYVSRGKYRVWFYETVDGDRKRRSKVVHGSRAAAEEFLASKMLCSPTFTTTYTQFWLSIVKPSMRGLAEKTVYEYERLWERELKPIIGDIAVSETTHGAANRILAQIDPPSVQHAAARLLKKIANMAVDEGLLAASPVNRRTRLDKHVKAEKELISSCDVYDWLDMIRGIKYEKALVACLGGGLRVEEAYALLHSDITPAERDGRLYAAVSVSKALVTVGSDVVLKETKTETSRRTVIIGEPFATVLLDAPSKGPICSGREPAQPLTARSFSSPGTVTRNYREWCRRRDARYVQPKNLRSSFATMHGEAMTPDSVVSGIMGHDDGSTKGRNYQLVTSEAMMNAADNLANYVIKMCKRVQS